MTRKQQRVLIVGGVAGGASCAARARRLSENAEIVVFERGPYVSFANCGLPYYVGDVITDEHKLLVATPDLFARRFNIDVRLHSDVTAIDRVAQEITVVDSRTGEQYRERYDTLVLATGATAILPQVPGVDLPGIFTVRTIPESQQIRKWLAEKSVEDVTIIGAGFIGLEVAENLHNKGISITIIDHGKQVLTPFDPEMATDIEKHLLAAGINIQLNDSVARFEKADGERLLVTTTAGNKYITDMVILGLGVRPNTILARQADLQIGQTGGIHVSDTMQTSDPKIYAVGDVAEVKNCVSNNNMLLALAGPANRQGRIAADAILGTRRSFRGVQGTAVCGVLGLTAAMTGLSEKVLKQLAMPYDKIYLHPGHHVGYYPDAKPVHLKLLYSRDNGRLLGAQAVGEEGVEKRIDVIAMAIQLGATVFDLEEAKLCCAPQYGAAKDPVNIAGMIAANALRQDAPVAHWDELHTNSSFLLDVREPAEFQAGHITGATNIPLPHLRARLHELPVDKQINVYCRVGQRGYYATRILRLNGLNASNVSGGILTAENMPAT